jgi:hypothetical protein
MTTDNPKPDYHAMAAAIVADYRSVTRWQPTAPSSPASSGHPEAHILAVLEPQERDTWNRLQPSDRSRLTREFRDDPISAAGLGYLRKKIVLLAPPAPDQAEAQPAAVSSSGDGKAGVTWQA